MSSASFSFHGASPRIVSDFPENGLSLTIELWREGPHMTLYFDDIHEWKAFREGVPLAENHNYNLHQSRNQPSLTGDAAKRFLEIFYHEERVKIARREAARLERNNAPEPVDEVGF